ncbi:MAG: hypothetical protein AAF497_11955, partial [Planctomycetota bacterium]
MNRTIIAILLTVCVANVQPLSAQRNWDVSGSGTWFSASNWSPIGVPSSAQEALINNGGTATATAGSASARLLDVGQNGGTGHIDFNGAGMEIRNSLDIGDVESTFASSAGQNIVSEGTVAIRNADLIDIGTDGIGDLNVGQTSAANGAIASGTGSLTLDSIGILRINGDLDVGQSSGTGMATGSGTAMISNITNQISVADDIDVGQASAAAGGQNMGMGTISLENIASLTIGADFDLGQVTG